MQNANQARAPQPLTASNATCWRFTPAPSKRRYSALEFRKAYTFCSISAKLGMIRAQRLRIIATFFLLSVAILLSSAHAAYIEPTWTPHNTSGSYSSKEQGLQAAKNRWDVIWHSYVSCRTWGAPYWGTTGAYGSNLGGCASGGVWTNAICPSGYSYDLNLHKCWDGIDETEPDDCDPITSECLARAEKGSPDFCPSPYAGNPINFATGNKFQKDTDYQASGSSVLKLSRSYNSTDGLWHHNYSTYLRTTEGTQTIALVTASGKEFFYTNDGSSITSASADLGVLSKTSTGWLFVSSDNERFTFDTAGKLTQWSNAQGAVHQLAYSGNQVTVTDNLSNSLAFTQDVYHQPLTLTTPNIQITYNYNANNRLISVNRTVGGQTTQRQFHYEVTGKPDLLTGITDERGVRYATWAYDDQGRAISSEHANGADRVTVAYNSDGTVSVTNELGKVAKYSFQTIRGVRRITAVDGEPSPNCPSSNSSFTYDDRGLLKTKTDNKSNLTTYTYNARGLETSRTEASGTPQARTITTAWHPEWFLPTTVTEPDRITQYTYDTQGRQTSQSVTQR